MRVLVACEESQTVCKAFRERGHEAFSADLQECSPISGTTLYLNDMKTEARYLHYVWFTVLEIPDLDWYITVEDYFLSEIPDHSLIQNAINKDVLEKYPDLETISICIKNISTVRND